MGFWPYFLQAHESDGGYASPLLLDPSTSPIGTDTTLFWTPFLLQTPPHNGQFPKIETETKKTQNFKKKINNKPFLGWWFRGHIDHVIPRRGWVRSILRHCVGVFRVGDKRSGVESTVHDWERKPGLDRERGRAAKEKNETEGEVLKMRESCWQIDKRVSLLGTW